MYDLDDVLAKLDQELQSVETLRQGIIEDMIAVQRTIALATGQAEADPAPVHGNANPEDIANCKTQMDAAVVLARRNGGVLMVTPASKVIKAAGLSEAKITSIAATLHNRASGSDDWQYIEPGAFRYVGNDKTKDSQWSEPISTRATRAQAVSPIVLTNEDRKKKFNEALREQAVANGGKISIANMANAVKDIAHDENWSHSRVMQAINEIRSWLIESEDWTFQPPGTFLPPTRVSELTPTNIRSIAAPRPD